MNHLATRARQALCRGRRRRCGLTLLELLVVITIMLILLAVMLPRLRPMMEQRRMREAARTVSVFFGAARSRAMETGRPVGVAIERLKIQPDAAVTLRMVEEPPLYAGDVIGARVRVRRLGTTNRFQ
ncbi:MAG: pilus assembly FimT family protein, partial [Thermogutta sp.]